MRRGVICLFILVAESWKKIWIFSKIYADADNAQFLFYLIYGYIGSKNLLSGTHCHLFEA